MKVESFILNTPHSSSSFPLSTYNTTITKNMHKYENNNKKTQTILWKNFCISLHRVAKFLFMHSLSHPGSHSVSPPASQSFVRCSFLDLLLLLLLHAFVIIYQNATFHSLLQLCVCVRRSTARMWYAVQDIFVLLCYPLHIQLYFIAP